jgi:hypothetical protein
MSTQGKKIFGRFWQIFEEANDLKMGETRAGQGLPAPCRNLQLILDFRFQRTSMEVSPPIQFRIEWADSQGMSPLLGCRPI